MPRPRASPNGAVAVEIALVLRQARRAVGRIAGTGIERGVALDAVAVDTGCAGDRAERERRFRLQARGLGRVVFPQGRIQGDMAAVGVAEPVFGITIDRGAFRGDVVVDAEGVGAERDVADVDERGVRAHADSATRMRRRIALDAHGVHRISREQAHDRFGRIAETGDVHAAAVLRRVVVEDADSAPARRADVGARRGEHFDSAAVAVRGVGRDEGGGIGGQRRLALDADAAAPAGAQVGSGGKAVSSPMLRNRASPRPSSDVDEGGKRNAGAK